MKQRIQKVLASHGVDSRRKVEQMVLAGRISVNDEVVRELPVMVDPDKDKIEVDGEPIKFESDKAEEKVYVLLNKPKGIYCTNVAQGVQKRAIDCLPPDFPHRVFPVGRLDADSRGLLLLTNDGDLTNRLTHPRYGISKTYLAEVEGYVKQETIDELNKGVWLAEKQGGSGSRTLPSHVKILNRGRERSTLEIQLREGRNRQVRRMLASLDHKVRRLTRVRMGKLTLQGVGPGHWRFLTPAEVRDLIRETHVEEISLAAAEAAEARDAAPKTPKVRVEGSVPNPGKRSKPQRPWQKKRSEPS